MKKFPLILCVLAIFCLSCCTHRGGQADDGTDVMPQVDSIPALGFWIEDFDEEQGTVKSGETFSGLMMRLGMSAQDSYTLAQRCDTIFDVRKMRAGNNWKAYYTKDTLSRKLAYVVYDNDRVSRTIFQCRDSLTLWKFSKPVESVRKSADVTITTSLWNDMLAAGASPLVILKLADIYAWTVDFFGLQVDDRFRMIYSQSMCDGEILSVDTVFYAVFTRGDKNLESIMFDQGDNGNLYWNENGESMRKAFLKAPLNFSRISSGFSYHRKHPVTGQVKAHTGVDYAAPTGTPVVSIGDGTVLSAGWGGAGGNTVKIRHNSVYTTGYLHLSKFASGIKAGARVSQGQVIGYVGSTGTSTGPHLDFRVWKNGSPINPLTMDSPPEEPILPENKPALDSMAVYYRQLMEDLLK